MVRAVKQEQSKASHKQVENKSEGESGIGSGNPQGEKCSAQIA